MKQRFVIRQDQAGERADKLLCELLPGVTRASVQRWIAEGRVTLDAKTCRARDRGRVGSILEVDPGPPPASDATPDESVEFGVLYEDVHLIVVDKPAGLVVHPGRGHRTGTLVNGLLARPGFERPPSDARDPEGHLRPGVVHRIDKDTSGILVVAKTEPAREGLKLQLAEHRVERVYRALVHGVPPNATLRTLHARHPKSRLRFTSLTDRGREAVTHVSVLERLGDGVAAFVECRLETGRTHQIRVHLLEQTHTPLLGDTLYRGSARSPAVATIERQLGRQALHAAVLGFEHPIERRPLRFEAALPDDMSRALSALRQHDGS